MPPKTTAKKYIRDGRAPVPLNEVTSKLMRSNKAKNTKPEILFRKALWQRGIRGYRLHWKKAPAKPDIAFPGKKVAIFVNGCFWHRCEKCNPNHPKTNLDFWAEKFKKNLERDRKKIKDLKTLGWQVIIIWECEIKKSIEICVEKLANCLKFNEITS